jgi:hypothetical protein
VASAYGVAELPGRVGKVFFSEKLKRQVESAAAFGFVLSRLEIGGYCNTCQKRLREFCSQFHKPWGTGFGTCRPLCFPGGKDTRM